MEIFPNLTFLTSLVDSRCFFLSVEFPQLLKIGVLLTGKTHLDQIALKCPNLEIMHLEMSENSFDEIESFYHRTSRHLLEHLSVLTIQWGFVPHDSMAFFSYFPNLCELVFLGPANGAHMCNVDAYDLLGRTIPQSVQFVTFAAICLLCLKAFLKHVNLTALRLKAAGDDFERFEALLGSPFDHAQNLFVKGISAAHGRYLINGEQTGDYGSLFFGQLLSRIH
jgi:hypothetical protein